MDRPLYFDYNATAGLAPEVRAAMEPWLDGRPANPSSVHRRGREARAAVERARESVTALFDSESLVVFTSGGTESDNLAITGRLGDPPAGHLIISAIEHPAIAEPAARLARLGARVSVVGVDADGRVDPAAVADAIDDDTQLVSIMAANNEIGTVQPIAAIADLAHRRGVAVHSDAVQAVAWHRLDTLLGDVDMVSLSGHKIGGPPGIGALVVRHGHELAPMLLGGGQQRGFRPGTEPTALLVGLGAAVERVRARRAQEQPRIAALAQRLIDGIAAGCRDCRVTVAADRLPNTVHLCFRGAPGDMLVARLDLDGLAASSGSACHSGVTRTSAVLREIGIPDDEAAGALRLSLGYETRDDDIEAAIGIVIAAVAGVRAASAPGGQP